MKAKDLILEEEEDDFDMEDVLSSYEPATSSVLVALIEYASGNDPGVFAALSADGLETQLESYCLRNWDVPPEYCNGEISEIIKDYFNYHHANEPVKWITYTGFKVNLIGEHFWIGKVNASYHHSFPVAANSERNVYRQLVPWCQRHWDAAHGPPPEDPEELVKAYFEHNGPREWLNIQEVHVHT